MIYQLLVYASDNQYEHTPRLVRQLSTLTPEGSADLIEAYKSEFKAKSYFYLHILQLAIEPENNVMEVLVNDFGTHPLKTRVQINPAAAEAKKAKPVKTRATFNQYAFPQAADQFANVAVTVPQNNQV